MKKIIIALLLCMLVFIIFTGCEKKSSGDTSDTSDIKKSESVSLAPVIEDIEAFLKKDTTLQESDIINIYIRNISYNEGTKKFDKDFKVFLDGKEQTYHDVDILGVAYYSLTVDISDITTGTVYVTYGDTQSNSVDFTLK